MALIRNSIWKVISLFIVHITAIWDPLCDDCVSLIYKIGNGV